MSRRVTWVVVLLLWLASVRVHAQAPGDDDTEAEPGPVLPSTPPDLAPGARSLTLTERLLLRQQWMMYREHERQALGVAGPAVGLVLGAGALAGGIYLFTGDRNERIGGMALCTFVAAPLLGVAISLLITRVPKRRAIEREAWGVAPVAGNPFHWAF